MSLLDKKKNIFSQTGEDGILEYIFEKMEIQQGTFFEFGAADGIWFSNTRNLMLKGWKGLFVESKKDDYPKLLYNTAGYPVVCKNCFVSVDGDTSIEKLWGEAAEALGIQKNSLDLLSIDVDGIDAELLESIETLRPKLILIEVNSAHPPLFPHRLPLHIAQNDIGQSMKVICDIASKKGYSPITYTGNLFLIQNDYLHLFQNINRDLVYLYTQFCMTIPDEAVVYLTENFINRGGVYHGYQFDMSYMKDAFEKRAISSKIQN